MFISGPAHAVRWPFTGLGQARAAMFGRDYVLPDDVKALAGAALGHRIIVGPAARIKDVEPEEIVQEILRQSCRSRCTGPRLDEAKSTCRQRRMAGFPAGVAGIVWRLHYRAGLLV